MNFEVDDIEEIISELSKGRNAIIDTLEVLTEYDYLDDINDLFRTIHTLKAKLSYFDLDEISSVVEKSEDIMSFLQKYDCTINESIHNWFDLMQNQFGIWIDEFKILMFELENPEFESLTFKAISFYDDNLDKPPLVKAIGYEVGKINTHRIIILLNDVKKMEMLEAVLSSTFKLISTTTSIKQVIKNIKTSVEPRVLISDLKFEDGNISDLVNEHLLVNTNTIILSKLNRTKIEKVKAILKTDNVFDMDSTDLEVIKKAAMKAVLPEHPDMVYIPLKSTKISIESLTKSLKPMPRILSEIGSACFDENVTYKEITHLIEQDAMITGKILRHINSPYYGMKNEVTTVKQALILLGKKKLYAVTMNGLTEDLIPDVDISMYGITFDDIITINKHRSEIIEAWCTLLKIPTQTIETITTISLVTVLGTILSAKAIDFNLQYDKFKILKDSKDILCIEKELLDYTSYDVCVRIFTAWNFPEIFTWVTKKVPTYTLDKKGVNDSVEFYGFILSIVHKIFKMDGTFHIDDEILSVVEKNGVNSEALTKAFKDKFGTVTSGHIKELH